MQKSYSTRIILSFLLAILFILADCGGGGGGGDNSHTNPPPINPPSPAAGEVFVLNGLTDSISVYDASLSGDIAPQRKFGSLTELYAPSGIAVDTVNNEIFVANFAYPDRNSITVYTRTVDGNVAPVRTISGYLTGLNAPNGIAVDTVNNEIFVANYLGNSITVYARTANGDSTPLRSISGLGGPVSVAVDIEHNEIFVANLDSNTIAAYARTAGGNAAPLRTFSSLGTPTYAIAVDTVNDEIYVNAKRVTAAYARTANGMASPLRIIAGSSANISSSRGLAVDTTNNEIFVTNSFPPLVGSSPSVTVYSRTADGNVTPLRTIMAGDNFAGIAVDAAHNELLVLPGGKIVTVYNREATGNPQPLRTISAKSTGLVDPSSLAVDNIHNEIFIGNFGFATVDVEGSIAVYAKTANGDVTPSRRIAGSSTGLTFTLSSIAVDTINDELFVAAGHITVFPRTASGNAAPLRTISGFFTELVNPQGIAVDASNNEIFVTDGNSDVSFVNIYARTADGDKAPLRRIFGDSTGLNGPQGIAVDDAHDEVFVANAGNNSVTVYARTAKGNTSPLRTISGASTSLAEPNSIAVAGNEIFVANRSNDAITIYSRTANGNIPPLRIISGPSTGLGMPVALALAPQ